MYSALNEDYMFQEMNDRIERIQRHRRRPAHLRGANHQGTHQETGAPEDAGHVDRLPKRHWWVRLRLAG